MKSYHQFCPVARALDVVGERWTLLVIRELLWGPKRYTDLKAGLPGVGPNVLAERLRTLENAGVITRRRLEPPAASNVYELTTLGADLRPVLMRLFEWGLRLLPPSRGDETIRASYWLPAIEAAAQHAAIDPGIEDVYEFRIDGETVTVEVSEGQARARQGSTASPDLIIRTDHETFAAIGMGRLSPREAIEAHRLSIDGDPAAGQRCGAIFGLVQEAEGPRDSVRQATAPITASGAR